MELCQIPYGWQNSSEDNVLKSESLVYFLYVSFPDAHPYCESKHFLYILDRLPTTLFHLRSRSEVHPICAWPSCEWDDHWKDSCGKPWVGKSGLCSPPAKGDLPHHQGDFECTEIAMHLSEACWALYAQQCCYRNAGTKAASSPLVKTSSILYRRY